MTNLIAGGCSFTLGNELSDDKDGKTPSRKTWAYNLYLQSKCQGDYVCTAKGGIGNSGIARRTFQGVSANKTGAVVVMWSFLSRYDWAMPRHKVLENTRWASISPWDTNAGQEEAFRTLAGSETAQEEWRTRQEDFIGSGVRPFAESIYKHAANDYHETYLSWKSIIWLQNILEKKKIPFMFTLADNSLFWNEMEEKKNTDQLLGDLYKEIDFTKWFFFGERNMGFNQWTILNEYERATTHPLDKSHKDATILMLDKFKKLIGGI